MKKTLLILSLAFAASSVMAEPIPKEIKARYDALNAIMKRHDAKAFMTFFDKNFYVLNPDGTKTSRKEFSAMIADLFKGATKVEPKEKFKDTKTTNGVVDVMFDFVCVITTKQGKMTVHEVGVDSWKKVNGKWLMIKTVDSAMKVTPPPKAAPKIGKH